MLYVLTCTFHFALGIESSAIITMWEWQMECISYNVILLQFHLPMQYSCILRCSLDIQVLIMPNAPPFDR